MKFIFTTHLLRGTYNYITDNGEDIAYNDISLYLGISEGKTAQEAWQELRDKCNLLDKLPEIKVRKIYAYEITNEYEIDIERVTKTIQERYPEATCEWCKEKLPSNGAAQYSHLTKHIKELTNKGFLTKEQAMAIRSIKLSNNIREIFIKHFLNKM